MTLILLVDDDEDCRIICRTFLRHAGFRVSECSDGESAIVRARQEKPDLILMDLSLPRVNGWEATRVLKGDDRTRTIPVVALTANAFPADQKRASEMGFDGYLTKPVSPRDVFAEVQCQMQRARHPAEVRAR